MESSVYATRPPIASVEVCSVTLSRSRISTIACLLLSRNWIHCSSHSIVTPFRQWTCSSGFGCSHSTLWVSGQTCSDLGADVKLKGLLIGELFLGTSFGASEAGTAPEYLHDVDRQFLFSGIKFNFPLLATFLSQIPLASMKTFTQGGERLAQVCDEIAVLCRICS